MSEENVVPDSTPEAEAVEAPIESVTEDSQPPETPDAEVTDSSTEEKQNVVDTILSELNEDEEPEQIPDDPPEPKEEEAKEETTDEPKEEKPTEAVDSKDELYEEPEGLKPKAQERFRSLVEANKSKEQELEESRNTVAEIQKTIQNTGVSPEEFGGLLDFARMANSQSPDEKRQAFNIAKGEMQRLAKEIGVEEGGVDLLDGFQDLQQKVDNYELDRNDAIELANARRGQQRMTEQNKQVEQKKQQSLTQQSDIQKSTQSIEEFMANRQKTDIDFDAKEKYLMGQVQNIQEQYPPSQWPTVVASLYDALGTMSGNQVQKQKLTASSPIQSSGQASGATNPASMADAIMSELS